MRKGAPSVKTCLTTLAALLLAATAAAPWPMTPADAAETAVAIFAGGCFWCTESDFEKVPGVIEAVSSYTGGGKANPTYEQVSTGDTGHTEAVQVRYDPAKVSYARLLEVFWRSIDPLDAGGQFCDRGGQYRSGIFYQNEEEKQLAEAAKAALEQSHEFEQPIATEITSAGPFYPAENYHQDYYKKNPFRYKVYRWNCGRDQRLAELWGPLS
jgi:methionine-S-sulfoxide reductase